MRSYYMNVDEIPQEFLEYMKQWDLSDAQKVEFVNTLQFFAEDMVDRHLGTGAYDRPDYDAAK